MKLIYWLLFWLSSRNLSLFFFIAKWINKKPRFYVIIQFLALMSVFLSVHPSIRNICVHFFPSVFPNTIKYPILTLPTPKGWSKRSQSKALSRVSWLFTCPFFLWILFLDFKKFKQNSTRKTWKINNQLTSGGLEPKAVFFASYKRTEIFHLYSASVVQVVWF